MIDAKMLLHMISALYTLEKLIPGEGSGEYVEKKKEWDSLKKACWAESGQGEETGQGDGDVKSYT
jgi:hypothetical protein